MGIQIQQYADDLNTVDGTVFSVPTALRIPFLSEIITLTRISENSIQAIDAGGAGVYFEGQFNLTNYAANDLSTLSGTIYRWIDYLGQPLTSTTERVITGLNLTIEDFFRYELSDFLSGNDVLLGSSDGDQIAGYGGNDYIMGMGSPYNDQIFGGDGIDTLGLRGSRHQYELVSSSEIYNSFTDDGYPSLEGWAITDNILNRDGEIYAVDIERIEFTDVNVGLDTDITGSSGQTALLIGAVLPGQLAFDESKRELLGNVIELFDAGFTMDQLSGALMRLPIWDTLTGKANYTNTDIANYLWTNVHGVAPTSAELSAGVQALNSQTGEQQGLWLSQLAQSQANQLHINLVGIQETGLIYL